MLLQVISKCLKQAHDDGMTSVAFPTLGCGFLGYPADVVSQIMKECIENFETTHENTSLRQLFVVVFNKARDWKHVERVGYIKIFYLSY